MEDEGCPRCKTTKYRNPNLKLLVNVCGHSLCENCVELLFVRGSGVCPECNISLRRNNFRVQLFEDAFVEKDVDIRKRILKDYNKKEEDFSTLRDFNDYLEEVETIIFNLTNGIDVEETKRKIELYKKINQESIRKNRSKLSRDSEYIEAMIEAENEQKEYFQKAFLEEDQKLEKDKKKSKDALIDELMFSDLPADHILASHEREVQATQKANNELAAKHHQTVFSTGLKIGLSSKDSTFLPVPERKVGTPYIYNPLELYSCGPRVPDIDGFEDSRYNPSIIKTSECELGGGFHGGIVVRRVLQDAFCGLFYNKDDVSDYPNFTSPIHCSNNYMEKT